MPKFAVIIAAAGQGERFGPTEQKTLAKLDGRPVFLRSLEHFVTREDVCQTILAVAPAEMDTIKTSYGANLAFMGVKLVEGGGCRAETVQLALKAVSEEAEYVAVHDAARPCVTAEMINAVFAEALKSGAAILAAPITGTIKVVGESMVVDRTEPRAGLYESQTPQVYRKEVIVEAYAKLDAAKLAEITDDARAVELSGHPVSVVKSDATNIKLTSKADMAMAHAVLKGRPVKAAPRLGAFEEAQW